jgi:hypothetical protein
MAEWADGFSDFYEVVETPPVNDLLFGGELDVDHRAQELFMEAFFDNDERAYSDLVDYMWDVYGIDFEDAFSWEDFREWYG